jgi:hypothetical protein
VTIREREGIVAQRSVWVVGLAISVLLGSALARGTGPSGSVPSNVTIDFTATVQSVNPLLPELAGLVGQKGVGHIAYSFTPIATGSFAECRIYYFDQRDRAFSFELPAGGLALQAGDRREDFNFEVCDGFRDIVDPSGPAVPVDRLRAFALGIHERLGSYDIATLTVRFADSTATAVSDMSLANVLVPERYDIYNFFIMIDLGNGRSTPGLEFSMESVTVQVSEAACIGDCNGDGRVTIGELILGVNISLGAAATQACAALDVDGDGRITIVELVRAVGYVLTECQLVLP